MLVLTDQIPQVVGLTALNGEFVNRALPYYGSVNVSVVSSRLSGPAF